MNVRITHGSRTPVFTATRIAQLLTPAGEAARNPTSEQAQIIEQELGGSVLVIAGAGSGKTETMANRVIWLVANGYAKPADILGLTFTRKAAGELNERIAGRLVRFTEALTELRFRAALTPAEIRRADALQEMLADGLDLPQVSTYNAFASGIVQEFGAAAGIAASASVIDEATAWRIARSTVCTSDDPEIGTQDFSVNALVKHVLNLDHAISENLTSCDEVEKHALRFESVRDWSYQDNPRKQPYAEVLKAVQAVEGTRLVARLARAFAEEKRRRGLVEFSDQLASAVRTVERFPRAIEILRERSPIVLLDEVQDTSVGQARLLSILFAGSSVMAVGDPHQSIYGFRGASASNLTSFHRSFATPEDGEDSAGDRKRFSLPSETERTLSLSVSWRNPQQVLTAANCISAPLARKLEAQAGSALTVPKLTPRPGDRDQSPSRSEPSRIEVWFPETVDEEFEQLGKWLLEARREHQERTGSDATSAVIFRSRKRMPAVQAVLHELGIPAQIVGIGGLLSTPEVTDIVSVLRCLWYADAGSELIRILTGPRFAVGVKDIDGLRRAARWFAARGSDMKPATADHTSTSRALPDPDLQVTILDALDEIAGMKELDRPSLASISEVGRERLREAGRMLRRLRQGLGSHISDLLRAVEHELRVDIELSANELGGSSRAALARSNLDAFADVVEEFVAHDEHGTLSSILEWIERAREIDDIAEHVPEPQPGTVQLITAHGSKGLEWDLVAIPRLVDDEFPASPREGLGWLRTGQLPDELRGDREARPRLNWRWLEAQQSQKALIDALKQYRADLRARHEDEERRLAYVAITRSASQLLLTGSWWAGTKKPRRPSVILRELEEAQVIEKLPEQSVFKEDPRDPSGLSIEWPMDPLGARSRTVHAAATQVREALHRGPDAELGRVDPVVEMLLAEHAAKLAPSERVAPPDRVTASSFHEFVESPQLAERNRIRPIPERPFRRTRTGNLFHEWVERRSTTAIGTSLTLPGFGIDELDDSTPDDAELMPNSDTEIELSELIQQFERSRFAHRQPIEVELGVKLPFAGISLSCKLDAVFYDEIEDRYEVVDWKTGRPPANDQEEASRFLQLELYRHAYAQWSGRDPEQIDVTLFYVAVGVELRGPATRSFEELERMWRRSVSTVSTRSQDEN